MKITTTLTMTTIMLIIWSYNGVVMSTVMMLVVESYDNGHDEEVVEDETKGTLRIGHNR